MIFLYIKTHNKTGLKYFGKTTQDPFAYRGSGKRWLNHINKHGYDVTTEIFGEYETQEECYDDAVKFSIDNDIVESKTWANLIIENGITGGSEPGRLGAIKCIALYGPLTGRRKDEKAAKEKAIQRLRELKVGAFHNPDIRYASSIKANSPEIMLKTKEKYKLTKHSQGEKNSQFGTMWITNEIESVKINKTDPIPEGWRKGRKMPR